MNLSVGAAPARPPIRHLWDDANRLRKIGYRFGPYMRICLHAAKRGVPPVALARTQFPFFFSDASAPPSVHVGLTNACNLRCVYCWNAFLPYPRIFMTRDVLHALVQGLMPMGVPRVIVGGGEPTLHPEFGAMARELRRATRFLSIVTNGQWCRPEIPKVLLTTSFDLIEVSVDAGGAEYYERSRKGGSYARILENLIQLRRQRDILRSSSLINIRLMIRPSTAARARYYSRLLSGYGDIVMRQYVVQEPRSDYHDDVYVSVRTGNQPSERAVADAYPKCSIPFKSLSVGPTGDVPLCAPSRLYLGNVLRRSLEEMWSGGIMRDYRHGHRTRELAKIPACKGCPGC